MALDFPTEYGEIINRVRKIDPIKYESTRNFIDGTISYLSPYISRGVISLNQIKEIVLEKYNESDCWKFFQELTWREFFQTVLSAKGFEVLDDLRHPQLSVKSHNMPSSVIDANTGVKKIDEAIDDLYTVGYMHNHFRMYIASICCNMAKTKWQSPARWMYYYLLDGDIASNFLSWQWVAGSFSSKQYYFNQDNLNKYSKHKQTGTFLDKEYDYLQNMDVPAVLSERRNATYHTILPETPLPVLDNEKDVLIYTSYNLDPLWYKDENVNRILLLQPSHFKQFPVSEKCIEFYLALAKNINGIQVYCGELEDIPSYQSLNFISKEHPAFNFPGRVEERDWLHPHIKGYFPSFSAYTKQITKSVNKQRWH